MYACVLNTFKTLQAKAELRKLQFEKAIYVYLRGIINYVI